MWKSSDTNTQINRKGRNLSTQIDIDRSRPIVAYIYLCKDCSFECVLDPDWIIEDSSIPSGDSDGTGRAEDGSGAITKGDHNDDDNKCTLTGPERLIIGQLYIKRGRHVLRKLRITNSNRKDNMDLRN